MNVKIDDNLLNKDKPIIELLKPIVYGVGNDFNYYRIGENILKAQLVNFHSLTKSRFHFNSIPLPTGNRGCCGA